MTQKHCVYDSQASDNPSTLFEDSCDDVTGCDEELNFLSGCHLLLLYHRIQDENALDEEGIEECWLPYDDQSKRLGEYDLFSGDYWTQVSNCFADNTRQRASPSSLEETKDQGFTEDSASFVGYQEESEHQPVWDYDFWSSCQAGDCYGEQEDPLDKGLQVHSYSTELGFCEDLFGYWPCLYQKIPPCGN